MNPLIFEAIAGATFAAAGAENGSYSSIEQYPSPRLDRIAPDSSDLADAEILPGKSALSDFSVHPAIVDEWRAGIDEAQILRRVVVMNALNVVAGVVRNCFDFALHKNEPHKDLLIASTKRIR